MTKVDGYCPMGCGQTLFLGLGGCVTCSLIGCPNPSAVDELLNDRQTLHVMTVGREGFTLRHPLRERIGNQLERCDVFDRIQGTPMSDWEKVTGVPLLGIHLGAQYVVHDDIRMEALA